MSGERIFCSDYDSLVYDSLLDNIFMRKAFQKYNVLYGLPKEESINIRKKLNLSISDFAKIIGCTNETLISYENGNLIPDNIYLVTIKTIIDNPEVICNLKKL